MACTYMIVQTDGEEINEAVLVRNDDSENVTEENAEDATYFVEEQEEKEAYSATEADEPESGPNNNGAETVKTLHVPANTIELLTNAMDYVEQCYKNTHEPDSRGQGASSPAQDIVARAARQTLRNGAGLHENIQKVYVQRSSQKRRGEDVDEEDLQDGAKCQKSAASPSHTSTDNDASNSSDKCSNCGEEEEEVEAPCHACTARFAESVDLKLKQPEQTEPVDLSLRTGKPTVRKCTCSANSVPSLRFNVTLQLNKNQEDDDIPTLNVDDMNRLGSVALLSFQRIKEASK